MAKLFFRYGAMGSSKTANALMVEYNYRERGKRALLAKPQIDMRDGEKIISSRIGLQRECIWTEELVKLPDEEIQKYDCIIVDEAQFCPKAQIKGALMGECWYEDCCVSEHLDSLRCGIPEVEGGNEKMRILIWSEKVHKILSTITVLNRAHPYGV